MRTNLVTSFSEVEYNLHKVMHMYFDFEMGDYLMFGILLCEWGDENTLKIIKSGFPPALTYQEQ